MRPLFTIFLTIILFAAHGSGADYRSSESIRVEVGDSLFTDLISGSRNVDILGYVDGDVYSGSQRMNVEGEITEDIFAGAQEVTIRGKVGDMLVAAGQMIKIDGEIGGDVIAFGAEVWITPKANIEGNLFVGTGSLLMDGGRVGGWIHGGAGQLYLNGSVGDSVILDAGHVRFGAEYNAPKGTKLVLKQELDQEATANLPENLTVVIQKDKAFFQTGFFYWSLIAMFIVGLLISILFKNFTHSLLNISRQNILKNIGIGFLSLIAIPILVVILAILILTIPAALILLSLFLILLYLSSIFTGLFVGRYIFELLGRTEEQPNLVLPLLVGLIMVVLLSQLPLIGWLIKLVAISFGMGNFVMYMWALKSVEKKA